MQGALIKSSQYEQLARQVQSAASARNISLWVGIPSFLGDMPDPLLMAEHVKSLQRKFLQTFLPPNSPVFGAGHSLGGVVVQQHAAKNEDAFQWRGFVLMGAGVLPEYNETWRFPTLQLGGELDGMFRITAAAQAFYLQFLRQAASDRVRAIRDWPVIVV